jgi:hypothetical protein
MSAATDKGIHHSPQDLIDAELTAAGWGPVAAHPHSATWISPVDRLLYPTAMALEMARQGIRAEDPFIAECKRAAIEAAKQSTKKDNKQ